MSKPSKLATSRVNRLESQYQLADQSLKDFEEEFFEIFEVYRNLVLERNKALKELEAAMRDARVSAGGMTLVVKNSRKFNGEALYDYFKNDTELRDKVVTKTYKVSTQQFDSLVKQGIIPSEHISKFIPETEEVIQVSKKPLIYQIG